MPIVIKPPQTLTEVRGKAYVHYTAWQETYPGLVDRAYLDAMTLELSERYALRAFHQGFSSLIAKDGEKVVGFVSYGPCRGTDLADAGEVYAIYILRAYYDQGVGRALMEAALADLAQYSRVCVWALEGNRRAIRFYGRRGFVPDGATKTIRLGAEVTEIRLVREN